MSDVRVDAGGFVGVAGGFGFVGDGVPVDLGAVVGGPFVTGLIVAGGGTAGVGETVGVVAVTDSGSADVVLGELLTAAGVECGAQTQTGTPVGSAGELAALLSIPATVMAFTGPDGVVVYMTATDRRTPTNTPAGGGGSGPARAPVGGGGSGGLDKLINVALEVSVELGRTRVTLSEVLEYDVGSIIELDRAAGAPVDVRVNDTLLAQGEVVLIDDEYAVRITAIIEPQQS